MLTLPSKFKEYLEKDHAKPATIVKFGDSVLENKQSTKGDWSANTAENQVDYTSVPGDVSIAKDQLNETQLSDNSSLRLITSVLGTLTENRTAYQSFKHTHGESRALKQVKLKFSYSAPYPGQSVTFYCQILAADKSTPVTTTVSVNKAQGSGTVVETFDFSSQTVDISHNTTYWIKIWSNFFSGSNSGYIDLKYQSTNVYANGQLDYTGTSSGTNAGDVYFDLKSADVYHFNSGSIKTQIIDMGETPSVPGQWVFQDKRPNRYGTTNIVYTAYGSNNSDFSSPVTIGVVQDGDPIGPSDWYPYYQVEAALSTTDQRESPTIESLAVSFVTYLNLASEDIFGYDPVLDNVSSLSTRIDDFRLTTIGQLTVKLGFTPAVSSFLYSKFPKNKPAVIMLGFVADDFHESDFLEHVSGVIDDWKITKDHYVNVTIKDASKSWSVDIPKETTTTENKYTSGSYQTLSFTNEHHIDAMLEILQNHINTRDSFIDFGSFNALKSSLNEWVVTRTLTGDNRKKADELLNELRLLTSSYFIPSTTGKIRIKRYDSAEASVTSFTDDDFPDGLQWESNSEMLYNKTLMHFDWDGASDSFGHIYIGLDVSSIANNNETATYEFKDEWTDDDAGGQGESQVQAFKNFIIGRYSSPPAKLSGSTDIKQLAYEVGDMVDITTFNAPSADFTGIADKKFQIVSKTFDFQSFKIKFDFLEVN